MSVSRSGPSGRHPSELPVMALEAGLSVATKRRKIEMRGRFILGEAADRDAKPFTDRLGDGTKQHALLFNAMQTRSGLRALKRQSEQTRRVQPVYCGPVVRAVTYVRRKTSFAGDVDQPGHEAAVARSMNRGAPTARRCRAHHGQRPPAPGSTDVDVHAWQAGRGYEPSRQRCRKQIALFQHAPAGNIAASKT